MAVTVRLPRCRRPLGAVFRCAQRQLSLREVTTAIAAQQNRTFPSALDTLATALRKDIASNEPGQY